MNFEMDAAHRVSFILIFNDSSIVLEHDTTPMASHTSILVGLGELK